MGNHSKWRALAMIGICMSFLFYKYLLQIFPSVMTDNLMRQYHLSGAALGNLAACFFYGYVIMQLFAGPLVDRFGLRKLSSISLLIASLGVGLFTFADTLLMTSIGRFMMGMGGAFATICYLRCTASWCSNKSLAFAGGCLTIGVMLGALLAEAPLAIAIKHTGIEASLSLISITGLILALISALYLRDGNKISGQPQNWWLEFKTILKKKENWLLAAYSGFAFAPLAVFGGLWGTPFLQASHHFDKTTAAGLVSLCYVGFGIGGPLFGYLSDRKGARQKWMLIGLVVSLVFLINIVYLPTNSQWLIAFLMLGLGFGTGSFMLGFTYGKEINNIALAGSIVAFINSGDALLGAITEPLFGKVLDLGYHGTRHHFHTFSAHDFRAAFILLVCYLGLAGCFALALNNAQTLRKALYCLNAK